MVHSTLPLPYPKKRENEKNECKYNPFLISYMNQGVLFMLQNNAKILRIHKGRIHLNPGIILKRSRIKPLFGSSFLALPPSEN